MVGKFIVIVLFIFFQKSSAMSSAEAVFRCKASIEKTKEISNQIKNADLKRVVQITLSLMQKNLEELLHSSTLKDIPGVTQQCMQHAELVTWLKDNIDQEMKTKTSEVSVNSVSPSPFEPKSKQSKKSDRKQKGKRSKNNQKDFNSKILKKIIRSKDLKANEEKSNL